MKNEGYAGMDKRKSKAETLYLQKSKNVESLIKKATLGIITENALVNFREGKDIAERREKRLERQRLSTKEKIILDCIADKFMKKEDCYYLRKSDAWKRLNLPLEEFPYLLEDRVFSSKSGKLEDGSESVGIAVILNSKEIREKTGLHVACWKISEWVWGLFDKAYFIGKHRIFYEDGRFVEYKFPSRDKYLHIFTKTIGKISRRKNIEEKHIELEEFTFVFLNEWSKLFLRSLLQGQFTIFPKPLYRLKDGHQELIRYLSIWGGMDWYGLGLHTILEVRNLLELKSKKVRNLKKDIKEIIDKLRDRGFVTRWEAYGRGWNTKYRIQIKFRKELFALELLKKLKEKKG